MQLSVLCKARLSIPQHNARIALWSAALLLCLPLPALATGITAVPPAGYIAPPAEKSSVAVRPFVANAGRTIRLPAPTAAELAKLKQETTNAKRSEVKRSLAIGIA